MSQTTSNLRTRTGSDITAAQPISPIALDLRLAADVMLAEMRRPYSASKRLPRCPRMARSPCVRLSPAQRDYMSATYYAVRDAKLDD
ncbi:hypothetical protein DFH09DRAFT_1320364 [Mycena vulgaris]|nr:hypothetical protein DFH09DRAFT_1320364 [Mycena vulgaris]